MSTVVFEKLSLKRRVIDAHMMIGLGCIFLSVVAAELMYWQGILIEYLPLIAAAPLILLSASTLLLRRTLHSFIRMENQLSQVAYADNGQWALTPLRNVSAAAHGWNCITEVVDRFQSGERLVQRLDKAFQSSGASNWQAMFDACPDSIAVTNADLIIRSCNRSFRAVADHMCSMDGEVKMETWLETLLGSGQGELIARATQVGCNQYIELHRSNVLSDGVWRLSRYAFNDSTLSGSSLWIVTDVTQRTIVEDAREQFVFTATHELRTPLANIRAYAETLTMVEEINFEEQKRFINIINAEATRLARFVDDLLNISQMEVGAITVDCHETDVMRMMQELKSHIQPLVEKKNQQFEFKFPAKMPKLWIDKDKIAGAITNLLSNANKYTPHGGQIRLILEEDSDCLNIHVEDTGIGISEDELPRICQKFFRSQDERVRDEMGSGIGLAFSQEVAKLHGGRIQIRSELNKGSRFTLSLPLTLRKC